MFISNALGKVNLMILNILKALFSSNPVLNVLSSRQFVAFKLLHK